MLPARSRAEASTRVSAADRLGVGVAGRGGGQLGSLDRLAAAGGELLGAELAHGRGVSWGTVPRGRHPVCSSSGATREKLSLFHSTLAISAGRAARVTRHRVG